MAPRGHTDCARLEAQVVPCVATDKTSVKQVLLELLYGILEKTEG